MMVPDYLYYGRWHLLPINFIMFNVVQGKADFFGTSPSSAYIEAYMPDHMGLLYPFCIFGFVLFCIEKWRKREIMIALIFAINLLMYSVTAHKETRFLMQIAPYLLLLGGYGFSRLYEHKRFRQVLGMVFWTIIFINVLLYMVKACGRPHSYRMYNRLLETHDVSQPASLGVYTGCYLAPHNILLHK